MTTDPSIPSKPSARRTVLLATGTLLVAGLVFSVGRTHLDPEAPTGEAQVVPRAGVAPVQARAQLVSHGEAPARRPGPAKTAPPRATRSAPPGAWPPVRPVPSPDGGGEIAASELLVVPGPGAEDALAARLAADPDVVAIRDLGVRGAQRLRLRGEVSLSKVLERVRAFEETADATPNAVVRATGHAGRRRIARHRRGALWNATAVHLPPRGALTDRHGRGLFVVALLDSGVAFRHHVHADGTAHPAAPALDGVEMVAPYDAIDGDPYPDDENGHGTFLADLIAGAHGLAPGTALMPVRVLDENLIGTEAALVEGLLHAARHGADVINLSLVFGPAYMPSRLLDAAVSDALSMGAVVVGAAGNDGGRVRYPAALPAILAVGASTPGGPVHLARASYSSVGAALDILAPGGDLEADANRDGLPDGILAESFDPAAPADYGPWLYAGTSQAAAHASAGAVWLLAGGVDPGSVVARVRSAARAADAPGFDPRTGGGMLDVQRAAQRRHRSASAGVQLVPVMRGESGSRTTSALVTALDDAGDPLARAEVHVRFRGTLDATDTCVTDRRGTCAVTPDAFSREAAVVVVQVEALVLRDGRPLRPRTVASGAEVAAALEGLDAGSDGTGFGSSSILWYQSGPSLESSWLDATDTFFLYGSGEGSALAPTVVALDGEAVADLGPGGGTTGGAGFGSSSTTWTFLQWSDLYFLGTFGDVYGGGFGSSSLVWSGYSFLWSGLQTPYVYDVVAMSLGRTAATSSARTEASSVVP